MTEFTQLEHLTPLQRWAEVLEAAVETGREVQDMPEEFRARLSLIEGLSVEVMEYLQIERR